MIEAKIIADSVNPVDCRLISFILMYPRFIHSELMTHRMFSRNAASSRAIPLAKMIAAIEENPAGPVFWGKNQSGMQASEELMGAGRAAAQQIWLDSCKSQIKYVRQLEKLGVHKQIANRLLEPFAHITTIVTATEWGNFFNLRAHKDAQPEFQELAFLMLEKYTNNIPSAKFTGEWHLPFSDKFVGGGLSPEQLLKVCTARAARISYLTFDNTFSYEKDFLLHDRLAESGHYSCFEHCAMALDSSEWSGNFRGFLQYRKTLPSENRVQFDAEKLMQARKRGESNEKGDVAQVERPV